MSNDNPPPEIVLVAHSNLTRVKELLAEDHSLLNIMYEPWQETPLGAASHVGNVPIAEFLLEQGAPLTITTAAMLGRKNDVAAFLEEDPAQVHTAGAHGISLLFHTALSGNVEIAELLLEYGADMKHPSHALQAAVGNESVEMVKWLLQHKPDLNAKNYQGLTTLQLAEQLDNQVIIALLQDSLKG